MFHPWNSYLLCPLTSEPLPITVGFIARYLLIHCSSSARHYPGPVCLSHQQYSVTSLSGFLAYHLPIPSNVFATVHSVSYVRWHQHPFNPFNSFPWLPGKQNKIKWDLDTVFLSYHISHNASPASPPSWFSSCFLNKPGLFLQVNFFAHAFLFF